MSVQPEAMVVLGKVSGAFGVKGWVKIHSYTENMADIFTYQPLYFKISQEWQIVKLVDYQQQAKGLVAKFEHVLDRDIAIKLTGTEIAVLRSQLPSLEDDEYYWSDLEGLTVRTITGTVLGKVDHLFETGANDVLVVKHATGEHWLPWVMGAVIKHVDLAASLIEVDWNPDF
ncbi:ribosome maturation factor RimM [uncultured Thiothrix sp.]|uniref:ribosome maturation factor RimM n=1 Tax=uncultured Thiothrix sp. TaxID=223185 RepID=UPI002638C1DB|nr:ribosome maturation factor RimM [uncultured Thiothrix sp.]